MGKGAGVESRVSFTVGRTNQLIREQEPRRGIRAMSTDKSSNEDVQNHTEAYYEELASQEEIYLEEMEERARAVLISEKPSSFGCEQVSFDREWLDVKRSVTGANNNPRIGESLDEQRNHAAEELVTGDPDDSPLSEEAVAEMLRTS